MVVLRSAQWPPYSLEFKESGLSSNGTVSTTNPPLFCGGTSAVVRTARKVAAVGSRVEKIKFYPRPAGPYCPKGVVGLEPPEQGTFPPESLHPRNPRTPAGA